MRSRIYTSGSFLGGREGDDAPIHEKPDEPKLVVDIIDSTLQHLRALYIEGIKPSLLLG